MRFHKRWRFSQSHFIPLSQCCFSFLSTTWFRVPLSMPTLSLPSATARWREIVVPTLRIVGRSGASCGVVLLLSFRVPGSPFTRTSHARRRERQTVGLRDVYGIHCYRLQSIVFLCSFVRCLCQNMFWHGRSDSS